MFVRPCPSTVVHLLLFLCSTPGSVTPQLVTKFSRIITPVFLHFCRRSKWPHASSRPESVSSTRATWSPLSAISILCKYFFLVFGFDQPVKVQNQMGLGWVRTQTWRKQTPNRRRRFGPSLEGVWPNVRNKREVSDPKRSHYSRGCICSFGPMISMVTMILVVQQVKLFASMPTPFVFRIIFVTCR